MTGTTPHGAALLEVRNLSVRYDGDGGQTAAVHDVSFRLEPGKALAIVGESGSGKSSVAGAILNFLGPAARVAGASVAGVRRDSITTTTSAPTSAPTAPSSSHTCSAPLCAAVSIPRAKPLTTVTPTRAN